MNQENLTLEYLKHLLQVDFPHLYFYFFKSYSFFAHQEYKVIRLDLSPLNNIYIDLTPGVHDIPSFIRVKHYHERTFEDIQFQYYDSLQLYLHDCISKYKVETGVNRFQIMLDLQEHAS